MSNVNRMLEVHHANSKMEKGLKRSAKVQKGKLVKGAQIIKQVSLTRVIVSMTNI